MTDEDALQSFLRVFDLEGDLLGDLPVQAIEYLSGAHYSDVDNHFYFGGLNADSDSMIFSKMALSGTTVWRRAIIFNSLCVQCYIIKLAPNGDSLFSKELGIAGFHGGQRVLQRGEKIYVFGYHYATDTNKSQIYIGQYNQTDGERNWGWYFDSIPNLFGLGIHDVAFPNDSTLFVLGSASAEFDFVMKLNLKKMMSSVKNLGVIAPVHISPNPTISGAVQLNTNDMKGRITLSDILFQFCITKLHTSRSTP